MICISWPWAIAALIGGWAVISALIIAIAFMLGYTLLAVLDDDEHFGREY